MNEASELPRLFAASFGAQDAAGLAAFFAEDGSLHSLTGAFLSGRKEIEKGLAEEFAGLSRMARLVSGRLALRPIGPGAVILHQRFVVTGLRDAQGAELPRVGALLTAVLAARDGGWQVLTATFGAVEG